MWLQRLWRGNWFHTVRMAFQMTQVLFQHTQQAFFGERLGQNIIHTWQESARLLAREAGAFTMLKIHRNIIATDVRRHRYDRGMVELPDQMTSRYTIKIRHYDVHQYHVVL